MLQLLQSALQELPSQDSQKQPGMTELEHMWQKMRKELFGNTPAMEFLLMSANTTESCDWGVAELFYYHHTENMHKDHLMLKAILLLFHLFTEISQY